MPLRTHLNVMHHGKRIRVEFEATDDSPEAVKAMFAERAEYQRQLRAQAAAKLTRNAFRKPKSRRDRTAR